MWEREESGPQDSLHFFLLFYEFIISFLLPLSFQLYQASWWGHGAGNPSTQTCRWNVPLQIAGMWPHTVGPACATFVLAWHSSQRILHGTQVGDCCLLGNMLGLNANGEPPWLHHPTKATSSPRKNQSLFETLLSPVPLLSGFEEKARENAFPFCALISEEEFTPKKLFFFSKEHARKYWFTGLSPPVGCSCSLQNWRKEHEVLHGLTEPQALTVGKSLSSAAQTQQFFLFSLSFLTSSYFFLH